MTDPYVPMERFVQVVRSITLVNNTAKTEDVTVPSGERWLLLNVKMCNGDDVNRDVACDIYKESLKTNLLRRLFLYAAVPSTKDRLWPSWPSGGTSGSALFLPHLIVLDVGNTISCTWETGGASTGAVDADGLVICYLKVEI